MSSTEFESKSSILKIGRSRSLLDALNAVSKWQPFALLALTFLSSLLLASIFGALAAAFVNTSGVLAGVTGFIGFVITASVAVIGFNAAGIWLSDEVWGRPQRSIMDAVLASTFSCHRLVAVLVLEFLLFLLFLIGLTLVFLICKVPGIGPFIYAFAMPVGAIASGVMLFALIYIAIPLASPAIWNGMPVMRTMVLLQAVARHRMLEAVVMMVLLGVLTFLVIGFVSAILISGSLVVASLSAAVLNVSSSGMFRFTNVLANVGFGGGGDYAYAIGFGVSVLFLVGSIPGVLIALKGMSIIFKEVSEGLNLEDAERALSSRMSDMKARAEAARQQALAPRTQQQSAMVEESAEVKAAPSLECPNCRAAITADDLFCGECGHKLK